MNLSSCDPLTPRCRAAVFVLFLLYELILLVSLSSDADLALYEGYAVPPHADRLRSLYADRNVEYPPLAVLFLSGVGRLAKVLPADGPVQRTFLVYRQAASSRSFKLAFRLATAALVAATFALLVRLIEGHFAAEPRRVRLGRLAVFALTLGPLGFMLHDRLDFALAALLLLFVAALWRRWPWPWSALVLAAAVGFKIIPIALAPLWLLATAPAGTRRPAQLLLGYALRGLFLLAAVLAPFVLCYGLVGPRSLVFWSFHRDRGLEAESSYAALLGVLKLCGGDVWAYPGPGSWEAGGTVAPLLVRLAPWLVAVPVLLAALHLAWRLRTDPPAPRRNDLIAGHVLLVVLVVLIGNKVLSPQYLLWLAPLAPLAPLRGNARRVFLLLTVAVAVTTLLIFPVLQDEIVGPSLPLPGRPAEGPTPLGVALLVLRTGLLLALAGQLAWWLARIGEPGASATGGSPSGR